MQERQIDGARLGPVPRSLAIVVLGALAAVLASGCSDGKRAATSPTTTGGSQVRSGITLQGSANTGGPWERELSLKFARGGVPTTFYLCAVWGRARPKQPCRAMRGSKLPAGSTMRLEQRPVGTAPKRADSPGWGLVATSGDAELKAVLSNFVSGVGPGPITYRATLRGASGRVLATSNPFSITWHK